MTQFEHPSILNPVCLYLRLCSPHSSPYRGLLSLCLQYEKISEPHDVLLIHDVLVETFSGTSRFFIIPKAHAWYSSNYDDEFMVKGCTDATSVISAFCKKQPNFEIYSPGFSTPKKCLKWWQAHTKCTEKQFREKHSMLEISWHDE